MLVHSEFLVLDHKNLPGGRLWSTDGACASGAIKSIWKVPKSYGGRSTMVGSETECECGPSSALQQLPRVASAASTRLSEYGATSSYVKLGMCRGSPHPSTRKKNSRNIWWGLFSGIYGSTVCLYSRNRIFWLSFGFAFVWAG